MLEDIACEYDERNLKLQMNPYLIGMTSDCLCKHTILWPNQINGNWTKDEDVALTTWLVCFLNVALGLIVDFIVFCRERATHLGCRFCLLARTGGEFIRKTLITL